MSEFNEGHKLHLAVEVERLTASRDHLIIEQKELCERVTVLTAELAAERERADKVVGMLDVKSEEIASRSRTEARLRAELAAERDAHAKTAEDRDASIAESRSNYRAACQLHAQVTKLREALSSQVTMDEMKLSDKHCEWPSFKCAFDAVMKSRRAAIDAVLRETVDE